MKKKIVIATMVLCSTGFVFAEGSPTTNITNFTQNGGTNAGDVLQYSEHNSATVDQSGLSGFVDVLQGRSDLASVGNENFLVLNQGGIGNNATLKQLGDFGSIEVYQEGQGNSIDLSQSGARNIATFTQAGMSNSIQGVQSGADNSATINQQGNGDTAIFTQSGNNNTLTISQMGAR